MKEIGYILFDLDGTLLNTRDGIVESVQEAIAGEGIFIDDLCLLERHIGPPLKDGFIEYYGFDSDTADKVVNEYRRIYREKGIPGTRPYEGMKECLQILKDSGFHLIVATSKPEHLAKAFLEHFHMEGFFEDICGSVEQGECQRRSKAEVIEYVLSHNGILDLQQVTMVGDRKHDVEGAAVFGIPCVGVLFGFGGEKELMEAGAAATVKDCKELTQYFLG